MAGSTFVDLTDDPPLQRDFIDLTTNGVEETGSSGMKKISKFKVDSSDGLSILESPPAIKENSNSMLRFAFKSSTGKSQPLVPKPSYTSNVGNDKSHLNSTRSNVNSDTLASTAQTPKAQSEEATQTSNRLSSERSDGNVQILETPPQVNPPEIAVNGGLESHQKSELDDQAVADKKDNHETLIKFEAIRYDFESLEASLEAYKASLQKILADVYNRHKPHVQVGPLTVNAIFGSIKTNVVQAQSVRSARYKVWEKNDHTSHYLNTKGKANIAICQY